MATKIDYQKINNYLNNKRGKIITASGIAYGIGIDRVYGGTMSKLVRDGLISPCAEKGFYRVNM